MSARLGIAVWLGACLAAAGCDYNRQLEECATAERCTVEGPKPTLRFPHNGFGLGSASAVTQAIPTRPYLTWDFDGDQSWTFRIQLQKCLPGQSLAQCPFQGDRSSGQPNETVTNYTWAEDLPIGSRYWWRVRACEPTRQGHPCGPWSDPRYFDVGRPEALPNDIAGNGQGAELAIGQMDPNNISGNPDQMYLYLGNNNSPTYSNAVSVGPAGALSLSYKPIVAGAGDINGDGSSDLAVGYLPDAAGTPGQPVPVHVYLSGSGGPLSNRVTLGPYDGAFGLGLGRAGDVDGDGLSDLVVCQQLRQRALIYFGKPGGPANLPDGDAELPLPSSDLTTPACAFAALADVDGDGIGNDDIAVSATGQIRVFRGRAAGGTWTDAIDLPVPSTPGYGASLAGGDFNGDGHGDLVVEGNDGKAYLYLGNPQWFSASDTPQVISFNVDPGMVAPAGDVNNDGFADLAVGGRGTGSVRLYLGQAAGAPRAGPALNGGLQDFATTFAGVGDVTDDSYDDVLVGGTNGAIVFRGGPSDNELGTLTNVILPPAGAVNFGVTAASGY